MEAIRRIISKKEFKLYNIPENFGEEAEIIIIPVIKNEEGNKISSFGMMKLQEKSGMIHILNEHEEDAWNDL